MLPFIRIYNVSKGKESSDKNNNIFFLKTTYRHPKICTIDYPKFIEPNQKEKILSLRRVNGTYLFSLVWEHDRIFYGRMFFRECLMLQVMWGIIPATFAESTVI